MGMAVPLGIGGDAPRVQGVQPPHMGVKAVFRRRRCRGIRRKEGAGCDGRACVEIVGKEPAAMDDTRPVPVQAPKPL